MPNWTNEQREAIEKEGCNIIVSAGAGSGKTAVLSERVLRKLNNGVAIDNLLVLTFTNAAAQEMKERIRKKIKNNSNLKGELEKLSNAYITTFDAYALSIVKKYSHLLNIENITITDQSIIALKKNEILDNLLNEYYEKEDPSYQKLLKDFCTKNDDNIKSAIIKITNNLDMIYNKEEYITTYFSKYFSDEFIDNAIRKYEESLKKNINEISNNLHELSNYVEEEYYTKVCELLTNVLNSNTYDEIKQSIIEKLPNLPKGSSEEAKNIKNIITEKVKTIIKKCRFESSKEIKQSLMSTKDNVSTLLTIIKEYDQRIRKYKEEESIYDFIDIAKLAINVLEKNPLVCQDVKEQFQEILIDEYQDTNDLQELFISLIEHNNVYMVGDIKQSIYRFRNANPKIFKNKYDVYQCGKKGYKIDLNKNFRARQEVIENINNLFIHIMDDDIGGANYKKTHQMIFGNIMYNNEGMTDQDNNLEILTYVPNNNSKEEIEAFIIAQNIQDKINSNYIVFDKDTNQKRPAEYSDFCILMDRSTSFDLYKKIFEYLNIPLTIYKDENICNNINVVIIKNIYTFIDKIRSNTFDKMFEYCYMSISRSYLFNIKDDEIFDHIMNKTINSTVVYQLSKEIANDIWTLTNQEIFERIISDFCFYEKMITIGDINNNQIVIEYLQELSTAFVFDDFKQYLMNIYDKNLDIKYSINQNESNGVKLMTIHKSKGLEFAICYFSGLYKEFNISDLKDRFLFDSNYGIIIPDARKGLKTTILKDLLKEQYLKDEISEKIRLLYVALTRAKEKMLFILPQMKNSSEVKELIPNSIRQEYRSFQDVMESLQDVLQNRIKEIDLSTLNITKDYNLLKKVDFKKLIPNTSYSFEVTESIFSKNIIKSNHFSKTTHELYDWKTANDIALGQRFHSVLETIDLNNPDYTNIEPFIKKKVDSIIKSGVFNNAINIYREYEFIYIEQEIEYHGIIDLLIEYKNEFWIIDYKLKSTTDEAYINQLNGYKKYLEKITSKKITTYLYSIIDEKLIKIIN